MADENKPGNVNRRLTPEEISLLESRTGITYPNNNVRWSDLTPGSRQILRAAGLGEPDEPAPENTVAEIVDNPHKRDNKKTGRRLTPAEITILEDRTGIRFPTNNVRWDDLAPASRRILETAGFGAGGQQSAEEERNMDSAGESEVTIAEDRENPVNENTTVQANTPENNQAQTEVPITDGNMAAAPAQDRTETGDLQSDEETETLHSMSLEEAIQLANGDLNSLDFQQIAEVYATLRAAEGIPNSPANQALENLRMFSEQKMLEGADPEFEPSMENAPELGAWTEINNDVQKEINDGEAQSDKLTRNQYITKKLQDFYAKYDQDNKLEDITVNSAAQLEENFETLEKLLEGYDPLARDEEGKLTDPRFEKISEFYDEMDINNDDDSLGVVTNTQLKREMADLAVIEAQTELLKDKEFKAMEPEAQKQLLAATVYNKMQEGVANLISAEMSQQFNAENAELAAKLQDENLSSKEKEELSKIYAQKAQAFAKAQDARLKAQTAYFNDTPVALTEVQKAYLSNFYKKHGKEFNPNTTWNQLSDMEKQLIIKGAEKLKDLQPTEAQVKSGKIAKPEPLKTTGKTALSTLYVRTKSVEHINKRMAQKSGFVKMWHKVKEFDRRLTQSHPKLWGFAKNFALTSAVSLTVGAPGVALIAAYKANKAINVVAKKAKMENRSFFGYLKAHPQEAVNTGLAVGGALLSVGFAGADIATHGMSSMGLAGQGLDYSLQHGTNLTDTIKEMASNFHGNSTNLAKLDFSQMAEHAKQTVSSGRFLSRLGLAAGNAASVATTVYNKQRTQGASKWKAFKASLGAGLGSMTGMAVSLGVGSMAGQAPDAADDTVDGTSGAAVKTPEIHYEEAPMIELTEEDLRDPELQPVPLPEEEKVVPPVETARHVNADLIEETDKALFDEIMARNAIIARSEFGGTAEARSEFVEQQTEQDFAHYRQLVAAGKTAEAEAFLKDIHEKSEAYEGEQARTPDADDSKKLTKMKLKAQKSFNEYQEKLHEAEMNPDDEKIQKALDKARMKYAKSMVDLSDREFKEMAERYEKSGVNPATIEEIKAEREILRHGKGAIVEEVVDKKVAGVGLYEKSNLAKAAFDNMAARNGR